MEDTDSQAKVEDLQDRITRLQVSMEKAYEIKMMVERMYNDCAAHYEEIERGFNELLEEEAKLVGGMD